MDIADAGLAQCADAVPALSGPVALLLVATLMLLGMAALARTRRT